MALTWTNGNDVQEGRWDGIAENLDELRKGGQFGTGKDYSYLNGKVYHWDPNTQLPEFALDLPKATPEEMLAAQKPDKGSGLDRLFDPVDRMMPTTTAGAAKMFAGLALGGIMSGAGFTPIQTALAKAGLSVATGGDPLTALANGGLSVITGTMMEGGGIDYSPTVDDLPVDTGEGLIGRGDPNVYASGTSDTGFGANKVPDDGMIDLGDNDATGSGASTSDTVGAERDFAKNGGQGGDKSWWKSVSDWATDHEKLAAAGVVGGLGLIGGVGQALLNKSSNEARIQADKDLIDKKAESEKGLISYKRDLIQGGSYYDSKLGVTPPQKTRQLRRPDGTPVYAQPGLIAGERR